MAPGNFGALDKVKIRLEIDGPQVVDVNEAAWK